MGQDLIRYDLVVQNALRQAVRDVLKRAARDGLPGDHHFYITFATGMPGVRLSPAIRAQYPAEMTIVLQHQFWDLRAEAEHFEVKLSFNAVTEHLVVPYTAIRSFVDPSVEFGLQFSPPEDAAGADTGETAAQSAKPAPSVPAIGKRTGRKTRQPAAAGSADAQKSPGETPGASQAGAGQAEIVQLDAFRKKN